MIQKTEWKFWSDLVKVFTLIKILWYDIRQAAYAGKPSSLAEFTFLQRRVGQNSSTAMWKTHSQLLMAVVTAKDSTTSC